MLTGGTDNDGTYGNPLTRVTSYNIHENVVVDLPELLEARMTHGCTFFSNNDNKQVGLDIRQAIDVITSPTFNCRCSWWQEVSPTIQIGILTRQKCSWKV